MNYNVEYEILKDGDIEGIQPARGTKNSSGIDVFVPKGMSFDIHSKADVLIPLYIRIKIPVGCDIEVKNKSGVATKKKLIKGAQLIDVDYRGNVRIHLINFGNEVVRLESGEKIAQLVVRPVIISDWRQVENIDIDTERGEGGFGSTDKIKRPAIGLNHASS